MQNAGYWKILGLWILSFTSFWILLDPFWSFLILFDPFCTSRWRPLTHISYLITWRVRIEFEHVSLGQSWPNSYCSLLQVNFNMFLLHTFCTTYHRSRKSLERCNSVGPVKLNSLNPLNGLTWMKKSCIAKYWELFDTVWIYLIAIGLLGHRDSSQAMPSNGSLCKNHVIKCKDSMLQARGHNRTKKLVCIGAGIQPGWSVEAGWNGW